MKVPHVSYKCFPQFIIIRLCACFFHLTRYKIRVCLWLKSSRNCLW
jgi:hypothetical protein